MVFVMLAAAALLAHPSPPASGSASPSAGAEAASKPAPAVAKTNYDDKVTCQEVRTTGSLIADRVCHTNAVWREMSQEAQDDMRENTRPSATPK